MTPEVARATREQMLRDGSCSVRWGVGKTHLAVRTDGGVVL